MTTGISAVAPTQPDSPPPKDPRDETPPPGWTRKGLSRWVRFDNAVVQYDRSTECNTSKPWLPGHRGYKAFGPGDDEYNYLSYRARGRRGTRVALKFKTPVAAMKAVDRAFPQTGA